MGALDASKIDPSSEDMQRLHRTLEDLPQGLLTSTDLFQLIFDTGCTLSSTPDIHDFVSGTLKPLPQPIRMDGIAGGLTVNRAGTVQCKVINDLGDVRHLSMRTYHLPELKACLVSPQAFLQENRTTLGPGACFTVYADRATLNWGGRCQHGDLNSL